MLVPFVPFQLMLGNETFGTFRTMFADLLFRLTYKAKNSLFKHALYVQPEKICLSFRREAHLLRGDEIVNRLVAEQSIYIPIVDTLTALF